MRFRLTVLSLLVLAACGKSGGMPEITQKGVFTETGGFLVEIKQLGTLANTYGPRLFPELPEYNIPVVDRVAPIYFNVPELADAQFKGIEWHGYRLGGNASPGTACPPICARSSARLMATPKAIGTWNREDRGLALQSAGGRIIATSPA